jgi:NADH:ubiquinone oxidoreductase subunit 4 (subunit M)
MNMQGVQGAVYQMLSHGVSTGGLFLIVGMRPIGGTHVSSRSISA